MSVRGIGQQFSAAIDQRRKGLTGRRYAPAGPGATPGRRKEYPPACTGQDLIPISQKVFELAGSTSAVAVEPGGATRGGRFYMIVCRVDPDQFVAVRNELWHFVWCYIIVTKLTRFLSFCPQGSAEMPGQAGHDGGASPA